VMLSAESASGKYPRESVAMMAKIVCEAEAQMVGRTNRRRDHSVRLSIAETICESVAHAAQDLDMRAIAVFTETGTTARFISKYRPESKIYGLTYIRSVCNRMNLLWGLHPLMCKHNTLTEEMVNVAEDLLLKNGYATAGDVIGIVAGTKTISGSTNFMRLHEIGTLENSNHNKAKRSRHRGALPQATSGNGKQKKAVAAGAKK